MPFAETHVAIASTTFDPKVYHTLRPGTVTPWCGRLQTTATYLPKANLEGVGMHECRRCRQARQRAVKAAAS